MGFQKLLHKPQSERAGELKGCRAGIEIHGVGQEGQPFLR